MKTSLSIAAATLVAVSAGMAQAGNTELTAERVTEFKKAWGEGIVEIGSVYSAGGDYEDAARRHIERFYAYGERADEPATVLFKPTLASEDQFRGTFDEALSYFVGGSIEEDGGFAIAPYTNVRWEPTGTVINGDMAMSMGNYYFTKTDGNEVKVEYTFGVEQFEDGSIKFVLHHSSLPFTPG